MYMLIKSFISANALATFVPMRQVVYLSLSESVVGLMAED